jgi:hypothetical protein
MIADLAQLHDSVHKNSGSTSTLQHIPISMQIKSVRHLKYSRMNHCYFMAAHAVILKMRSENIHAVFAL